MPGGSFGVDIFFVLSGFLITALLVTERDRTGGLGLGRFYLRRARRLVPALVLVLLFVTVTWGLLLTSHTALLRGDAIATLAYFANWHFAFTGQGYFASFSEPSPLLHTWSLAVEEQFYLLWPLAVSVVMARGRSVARFAGWLVALSFAATLTQSLAGVWTDRLYYGTDTRAMPLLLGASFGAWYVHRPAGASLSPSAGRVLQAAGFVAAAGIGWFLVTVGGQSTALYRGGFLLLAALVVIVIAAVAMAPQSPLARSLSWQPLRYIGVISYGIYLWHWPIFLLLNHQRTHLSGAGLFALRTGVTLVVSIASYQLIELPIREQRFRLPHPKLTSPIAIAALVGVLIAATPPATAPKAPPLAAGTVAGPVDTSLGKPAAPGSTRLLFVGDSVALSLAEAMAHSGTAYSVHVADAGLLGCGIALGSPRRFRGVPSDDPSFCRTWPQLRAKQVATDHPAVVAVLVGEWELMDRFRDGRWQHIGQPAYDAYLVGQLDLLIRVTSGTGAKVALLTTPCRSADESPSGAPWPETDPARLDRFNALLRQAATRHPGVASVVDLKALVCPGGTFTPVMDGVTIRSADGIHFPLMPLPPIAAKLLPQLRALAR